MPKTASLTPRESSALAAARRALAAGRLTEVAKRYEEAARAREAAGESPYRHRRRALDFWVEAGEPRQGLACARKLSRARLPAAERAAVRLAMARLHLLEGRAREATSEFAQARRLFGRDRERARQAALGEAQARVEWGDVTGARRILERCRSDSRKAGDSWAAATALLRLGQLDLRVGDPWAAREALIEACGLGESRHLLSIEAESAAALAEAELGLGRAEHALRHAEHAAHVLREMERDVEADRLLGLEGAALAARYEALEPGLRETAGPALRRQALRQLGRARQRAGRDRNKPLEALLLLREATLLSTPGKRAAQAEARLRGLGPGARRFALAAHELVLAGRDAGPAAWRKLGRRAERAQAWDVAARAWLRAQEPARAWRAGSTRAALELAERTREPEPRSQALGWVLAARSAEQQASVAVARPGQETARVLFGLPPERPARDADPEPLPRLRPGERLVVLSLRGEEIVAWVAGDGGGVRARISLGSVAAWREAGAAIDTQVHDAAGWPDSVVPEHLVAASRASLEALGAAVWTPLFPALTGSVHVMLVPDPALPALPWAGLLLAAPPVACPRPRSLSLLPSASVARPSAWKLGPKQALALAERVIDQPLAEREARAVARVLAGTWKTISAATPLPDLLRHATLHHWASTLVVSQPAALTRFPDGDAGLPQWRLARAGIRPALVVAPRLDAEGASRIEVARIVGRVGPEGARRAPPTAAGAPSRDFADARALARTLLAGGAARALVNAWPFEAPASAGLVGSFYAGLARDDVPTEALFTAQRRAHEEGLHPAAWAGFSIWGWP